MRRAAFGWRGAVVFTSTYSLPPHSSTIAATARSDSTFIWLADLSDVVAGVLGAVYAFGVFCPALVRHGGELKWRRSRRRSSRPCCSG
jgi:hypothetical protein